jgi:CRP/FNR family cyclic AMP-dependent transcriptional regulator
MELSMQLLRKVELFHDLTDTELARIWQIVIARRYRKRTVIFAEGRDKEAVFFIVEGLVKTFKTDENGNEYIMSFLQPGEMFPHTGFFDPHPYPATAEAIVDTRLLAIPVAAFEQLIGDSPLIAIKLMRVMSGKIRELQEKVQELTGQDVQDRVIAFLIKLADNYGQRKEGRIQIALPMTNQEFANTIGTTRETVNRLINQLRKEQILELHRSGYTIYRYDALQALLHN